MVQIAPHIKLLYSPAQSNLNIQCKTHKESNKNAWYLPPGWFSWPVRRCEGKEGELGWLSRFGDVIITDRGLPGFCWKMRSTPNPKRS